MKGVIKRKEKSLDGDKNRSQDLRRTQKRNVSKTIKNRTLIDSRKWSCVLIPALFAAYFSWFPLFLTIDRWKSLYWTGLTRRTWLFCYITLDIAKTISLAVSAERCHDFIGWRYVLLIDILVKAWHVCNSSNSDDSKCRYSLPWPNIRYPTYDLTIKSEPCFRTYVVTRSLIQTNVKLP